MDTLSPTDAPGGGSNSSVLVDELPIRIIPSERTPLMWTGRTLVHSITRRSLICMEEQKERQQNVNKLIKHDGNQFIYNVWVVADRLFCNAYESSSVWK